MLGPQALKGQISVLKQHLFVRVEKPMQDDKKGGCTYPEVGSVIELAIYQGARVYHVSRICRNRELRLCLQKLLWETNTW